MSFTMIPDGLAGTTVDRIAKLARLITIAQDGPDAAKLTNKVLPGMLADKAKRPLPVDQPQQGQAEPHSLRE